MQSMIAYSLEKGYKRIGHHKQLFLDDEIVGVVKNIKRTFHEPAKHPQNPLIRQDKPWERLPYFRCNSYNVVYDAADELFKCFYADMRGEYMLAQESHQGSSMGRRICMATSGDGICWEKPSLGKLIEDGRDTNVVFFDPEGGIHAATILVDPVETDLERRYKAIYLFQRENQNVPKITPMRTTFDGGLSLAFSPDGTDWTPYEGNPIITEYGSDVQILTYDPIERRYVLMGRADAPWWSPHPDFDNWYAPYCPDQPHGVYCPKRLVYRMDSDDLINWSAPVLVSYPRPEDDIQEQHYGICPWRVGEYHLGFLNILQQVDNTFHFELVYSRDGYEWHRFLPRQPVIPRGEPGSFDEFMVECPNPPLTVGDEHWIYYAGNSCHHDWWLADQPEPPNVPEAEDPSLVQHHLGLATIRVDGWVSLDALVRSGYIETKPVFSTGSSLIINAKCHDGGHVAVEVMDNWNNPWPGFTRDACDVFTGDDINHVVSWNGRTDVNSIPGVTKLRFHLKRAEFYSFRIADK